MSVLGNSQLLMTPEGYQISRSVRLRSSASAYFSRTPASAGNRKTWTWSGWVKRGALSASGTIPLFSINGGSGTNRTIFAFDTDKLWHLEQNSSGTNIVSAYTSAVLRDPSAWYHIVLYFDSPNTTLRIYVNGVQQTLTGTTSPSLNYDSQVNSTSAHSLGAQSTNYFDGYLTEVNFIDGQALTPSSFGETDVLTGVWKPKKYAGTYGTNGFYLNFSDNSSNTATTIGKDYSGNGNNWTPNNISVTAGVTYDSMIDTPTPYADGGNGRGNYAVLNPLLENSWWAAPVRASITNGNLNATASANDQAAFSNWDIPTDTKVYLEVTANGSNTSNTLLVAAKSRATFEVGYYQNGLKQINGNTSTSYGASWTTNDVIGIAIDRANNSITFYKNGVSQGEIINTFPSQTVLVGCYLVASGQSMTFNFGQRPFAYTPPTGFKALNTQNLPEPTIKKGNQYFDATIWTGDGSSNRAIVNAASMAPDWVWIKSRSGTYNHRIFDSVRGANKRLVSSATDAEASPADELNSFNADGFTVGADTDVNASGSTYVGWQWKAGGTPAVTNTAGSITSTVSANTTSGFSVVTYTSSSPCTVGHGLGVAPSMIITKSRNNPSGWSVYHASFVNTGALNLQATTATSTSVDWWSNTSPTSSVFSIGANIVNGWTWVAYLFSEVAGFSRFGSYTGNGSADGPFIFCGFRPRWVMIKRADSAGTFWIVHDTARSPSNAAPQRLFPNASDAEGSTSAGNIDILSNGFKLRNTDTGYNASGGTYIFMAFAESPFKNSLAR